MILSLCILQTNKIKQDQSTLLRYSMNLVLKLYLSRVCASGVRTGGWGSNPPPFGDGTGNEDLSFYFNHPLLLRTELAEIANMSLLFNSPV